MEVWRHGIRQLNNARMVYIPTDVPMYAEASGCNSDCQRRGRRKQIRITPGVLFQSTSTPGDSDKLPNPREESLSSVPLPLLYFYAGLGAEKSRATAAKKNHTDFRRN